MAKALQELIDKGETEMSFADFVDLDAEAERDRPRVKVTLAELESMRAAVARGETVGYRDADGTCYCLDHVPELVRAEAEIRRDMRITRQTVDESSEVIMCKTGYHLIV